LASLELGETSVSRIARKSGIKLTTVYLSLENLMQKGLISAIKKEGKTHYFAEDPRNLERIMAERKEKISQLMPELLAFSNILDKKPEIRYFEGEEGIKEVFKYAVENAKQEICLMYSETYLSEFDEKFFSEYLVPKRLERKVLARTLVPDNEQMRALESEKILRKIKFLPPNLFKIKMEVLIYGNDKVSIISFREKFALIIESRDIHDSFQSIFEVMWLSAKDK
jgi:sugar-specific transcriptional regulator TrmB